MSLIQNVPSSIDPASGSLPTDAKYVGNGNSQSSDGAPQDSIREAQKWAERGFSVFPLAHRSKKPFRRTKGVSEASRSPTTILSLFADNRGRGIKCNIGLRAGGCFVLDVDTKTGHGVDGYAELAKLGGLPDTFTVRTPTGGLHIYFDATGEKFVGNKLAPGIDIRTGNQYTLAPGSRTKDGTYTVISDAPIAPLPAIIRERAQTAQIRTRTDDTLVDGDDSPQAIEAARELISQLAPADDGDRNNHAYRVFAQLYDLGVSRATGLELIEVWNEKNDSPLDSDELGKVSASALKYRQKSVGSDDPAIVERAFSDVGDVPEKRNRFYDLVRPYRGKKGDGARIPPRPWVAKNKLTRKKLTTLVAPGATGKSTLTLQWAMALALGKGHWTGLDVVDRANTLVINNEEDCNELDMKIEAACQHFKIDRKELHGSFFTLPQTATIQKFAAKKNRYGRSTVTETVAELIAYMREKNIGVLVVDPLVSIHDANENDNGEMQAVMEALAKVAHETNAAVLVVHHTSKPSAAGSGSYAGSPDAGRGASSIRDAVRTQLTLFAMSKDDPKHYNVKESERHLYVRLDNSKVNMIEPGGKPQWFKKCSVLLENGEFLGVLEPTTLDSSGGQLDLKKNIFDLILKRQLGRKPIAESDRSRHGLCSMFCKDNPEYPRANVKTALNQLIDENVVETFQPRHRAGHRAGRSPQYLRVVKGQEDWAEWAE